MKVSFGHIYLQKVQIEILPRIRLPLDTRIRDWSKCSYQSRVVGKKVLDWIALDKGKHMLMAF